MPSIATRQEGELITKFRKGFPQGYTPITREGGSGADMGLDFGIYRQARGQTVEERHAKEAVWVLLRGKAELDFSGKKEEVSRESLFDERATALHLGPDTPVRITAAADSEWAVARAKNAESFEPKLYRPQEIDSEFRGKGLAQDACLRNVQLIFDREGRPKANIVIGEVINYPGKWSSYPPHHHEQPEIYHYRFTEPQGFGFGQCGTRVHEIRQNDTLKIPGGNDHSQVSAPGYGMYYLWVVRHLPGNPYTGFEFTPDHKWVLDPKNQGWRPKE